MSENWNALKEWIRIENNSKIQRYSILEKMEELEKHETKHGVEFDDEICECGHSKGYHEAHELDKHGDKCEKCDCIRYTWRRFVKY